MKPTHVKDWITRKNTLNTSSFPRKNFKHQFILDFSLFFQKNWNSAMFFQTGLCHFFKGNWGKLIFENTLSLIQNLLPFKKTFFWIWTPPILKKIEKTSLRKHYVLVQNLLLFKKVFFKKTFFQSGLCRFFREKLRKTFLRKHYVLVQNLLLFKKVFFQ